jgi:SAM-dependent methyltransferase
MNRERITELVQQASRLERTDPAAVSLLEEAARIADTLGDVELGCKIRLDIIDAGCWSGKLDRMIVAFAWCLAQYDRDPSRFSMSSLYWRYKWVVNEAVAFPEIPRAKIEAMLDDMAERYRRANISLRPVHSFRCWAAMVMGDTEAAARHYEAWRESPRDLYANCSACEADERVGYHVWRGADEEALEHAAPILARKLSCAEVPHRTYGQVLLPLLRLGRTEEAADAHRRGYRLLADNGKLLGSVGGHLAFLALTGNHSRAARVLERYLPHSLEARSRLDAFQFLLDARLFLGQLAASGRTSIRLRLPKSAPVWQKDARYEVAAIDRWLAERAAAIAADFDRRNGNPYTSRRIELSAARASLARPLPLTKPRADKQQH